VSVPSLPALPPRSATEIVDGAIQLIRPHFGYFLRIAAVGAIPGLINAIASLLLNQGSATDPISMLRRQTELVPLLLTLLVYLCALLQSAAIVTGALAVLRGDTLPPVITAFLSALTRLPAIIGSYLLIIAMFVLALIPLAIVIGIASVAMSGTIASAGSSAASMIAVAVFGVVALVIMLFIGTVVIAQMALMITLVIAEGIGPFAALKRAQLLSRGNYGLLARTYGLVFLIMGVLSTVLVSVAIAFLQQQQLVQAIFSVIFIPVAPIIGSIGLLTYADLRVRREGADLDASLDALTDAAVPSR
jgi:hypothetical protein